MELALEKWYEASQHEPPLKSLESRLVVTKNNPNINTNLIIIKHQRVQIIPFLRHYFIQIGFNVWHPGRVNKNEYFERINDEEDAAIINEMYELCDYCTYFYFKRRFIDNTNFFLLTRNCEVIIGHYEETIIMYCIIFLILYIAVLGPTIAPIIFLLGLMLFFVLIPHQKSPPIYMCRHIRFQSALFKIKEDSREIPKFSEMLQSK